MSNAKYFFGVFLLSFLASPLISGNLFAQSTLAASPSSVTINYLAGQPLPPPAQVTITAGGAPASFSATWESNPGTTFAFSTSGNVIYIALNPFQTPSSTNVSASLTVTATNDSSQQIQIPVNLTVGSGNLSASPTALVFTAPVNGGATPNQWSLRLTSGSTAVSFTTEVTTSNSQPWLSVNPPSGTTVANAVTNLTVTVNSAGLSAGAYTGQILLVPSSGGTPVAVGVTFYVGKSGALLPYPQTMSFAYTFGAPVPQAQPLTVAVASGPALTYSASAISTEDWLLINNSTLPLNGTLPGTLNISVNAGALGTGSYEGAVFIQASDGSVLLVPVTLTVTGGPGVLVSPSSLSFSAPVGQVADTQQVQVTTTVSGTVYLSVTAATTSGGSWLRATPSSSLLPAIIQVSVVSTSMAAGNYSGTITISTSGSTTGTQTIPVNLVVGGDTGLLGAFPTALSFSAQSASSTLPPNQYLLLQGTNLASYAASATTDSGGTWLQINKLSGRLPDTLTVAVNTSVSPALGPGTYTGKIAILAGSNRFEVPVSLTITTMPVLYVNPGTVTLTAQGDNPPPIAVSLPISTSAPPNLTYTASTTNDWITLTSAGGTTPAILSAQVDPAKLPLGVTVGGITLVSSGAANSPLTVPVVVSVSSSTQTQFLSPTTLNITAPASGAVTAAQYILVNNGTTGPYSVAISQDAASWLVVSPMNGNMPESLKVQVNPANLQPGSYTGTITVAAGGVSQTATVNVTITAGGGATTALEVSAASLNFTYLQGNPPPSMQAIHLSSGIPVNFTVSATSSGDWLSVSTNSQITPADLSVAVAAVGMTPGTYQGAITISSAAATNSPLTVPVTLTVAAPSTITLSTNSVSFSYRTTGSPPGPQTVNVTSASVPAGFTTVVTSATDWLSVTPTSGTTPAALTISVNTANLSTGTYHGTIAVTGGSPTQVTQTIAVVLAVNGPLPTITKIGNAASYLDTSVAPGEIVTLQGSVLGPKTLSVNQPDSGGMYGSKLAGTQVLVNGIPAPLIYTREDQVSAIVPYSVASQKLAFVQVDYNGQKSNAVRVTVAPTMPGLFTLNASGQGQGAILNEDDSVNMPSNPASQGSVVVLYATGAGIMVPAEVDGLIVDLNPPFPKPMADVSVQIGGKEATVQYAGAAPGLVAGVLQVNVQLPAGIGTGEVPVVLTVGGASSQAGVTLSVR